MAFDALVSRHQERVFALAYHMLDNAEDAADVQQEAFLLAWRKLRGFRGQASFGTWLHRITINSCIGRRRKKLSMSSREEPIEDESNHSEPAAAGCQDRLVDAIAIRQLLAGIPEQQRSLLLLREVDGMSVDEIARIRGSSYQAVVQQLWRVRKLFRERLRGYLTEDEQ